MHVDLSDPTVQRLMQGDSSPVAQQAHDPRELVTLGGDDAEGFATTYNMSKSAFAHPYVFYKDLVLRFDAYRSEGEPLRIHLMCPRCGNYSWLRSDQKQIDHDMSRPPPETLMQRLAPAERRQAFIGGELSVEKFTCSWELRSAGKHVPGLVGGGLSLCKLTLAIDHNVAKDA
jgi:hypothetical protein